MTYDELAARLAVALVTDPSLDADFTTILPQMIEAAELRCYRDLVPLDLVTTTTIPISAGTRQISLPANFISTRSAVLVSGTTRTHLRRKDDRYLSAYWPDTSLRGTPKYYAEYTYGVMDFMPPANATASIEVEYVHRPATLSDTNPTNWLSTFAPDLLFYACLVWAAGYQKVYGGDDPKAGPFWDGEYQKALANLAKEEVSRRGFGDTPPV
jgi:hypothetical protein